jgi:hypothetical protein
MRIIELSTDAKEKQGYMEVFGLVDFEKRGNTWFMNIKSDFEDRKLP